MRAGGLSLPVAISVASGTLVVGAALGGFLKPDISAVGFLLVGARVSVVADAPSATVVYRSGAHLFSVFAIEGRMRTGATR